MSVPARPGRPVPVSLAFEAPRGMITVNAGVLGRTGGGVRVRFEPKRTFAGQVGTLCGLMATVDGVPHALLVRPLEVPGRLLPDGGREATFAFVARDGATDAFLATFDAR